MSKLDELLKDKIVELVEEHFPKGDKSRGKATLMMAQYLVWFTDILEKQIERAFKAGGRATAKKILPSAKVHLRGKDAKR